jgi:proteasome lid subunit RPN8/RPN11
MLGIVLVLLLARHDPLSVALTRREVVGHMADLLRCGGYGRLPTECAAFLVATGDRLEWVPWPRAAGFQRAQWNAPLPAGAIVAIVHTHPRDKPNPSPHDEDQARRLGIPIVAVTPATLALVRPDGRRVQLIDRFGWAEGR